jgi:colanic acid/amylovoran biosynthesis glycosyltransferase
MPMQQHGGPVLVVTPAVHAARADDGVVVDDKTLSGIEQYVRHWPGTVRCIFREGPAATLLFACMRQLDTLPCDIALIPEGSEVPARLVADAAAVVACGDNHLDLPLARVCRHLGVPLIYVIENTLATRVKIAMLEPRPLPDRLKSVAWHALTEVRRRAAFRLAAGLAANGVGASDAYAASSKELITFFDSRTTREMMATERDLAAKLGRLGRGEPLRLGFSGRLEALKGADHLIAVARCLAEARVPFSLDIFGTGSLEGPMRQELAKAGLERQVTMHGAVDFQTALVPFFRSQVDLFVCCHRQSDPSCTYLEAMACGVAIAGYGNGALLGLLEHAKVGVASPMGQPARLAQAIAGLAGDRARLGEMMRNALALASAHDVSSTFSRRVQQCLRLARPRPEAPVPAQASTVHSR